MPDIDQVRGTDASGTGKMGLPNNGKMWCLPTSGMNILAYLADLGYTPGVASKDWTLDENYNEMSAELLELGEEMNTSPTGGTGGTSFKNAMAARLELAGDKVVSIESPGLVQWVNYTVGSNTGPNIESIAHAGLDGHLVTVVRGKYADEPDPDGEGTVKRRTGGHMMTMVGATATYGSPNGAFTVHDPATEYVVDFVQTPYADDPHTMEQGTFDFIKLDKDTNEDVVSTKTLGVWDGNENRMLEGFYHVVPNTTWVQMKDPGKDLKRMRAFEIIPPGPDPVKTRYELPGSNPVSALALSAATPEPAYLIKGSSKVRSLDPVTGDSTLLDKVKGAHALVFGGDSQRLFVAGAKRLVALDGITGEQLASRRLKQSLGAIAFDERRNLLVGVAAGGGKLKLFGAGLRPRGTRGLDGLAGDGKPLLAIGPGGGLVLGSAGSPGVFSTKLNAKQGPAISSAARRQVDLKRRFRLKGGIRGLVVDELGHIIVAQGGKLKVFTRKGKRLRRSRFRGRAKAALAVTRSFSNADPEILTPTADFFDEPDPRP
jgi:hypothetical protein